MGAGLFAKTLANLKNTRTGFESARNLVSFQVDPAKNGYTCATACERDATLTDCTWSNSSCA